MTERVIHTYAEIDSLVKAYKNGDRLAAGKLLQAFEGFLFRYANMVKFGIVSFQDKDIMTLVRMICGNDDKTFSNLRYVQKAMDIYDIDDIMGDLKALFLEACLKFQKQKNGPPFPGFLYAYFKTMVHHWIRDKMKQVECVPLNTEVNQEEERMQIIEDCQEFEKTFGEHGAVLSRLERWILHQHFHAGLSDEEIAQSVNTSRNWIYRQRAKSIKKLRRLGYNNIEEVLKNTQIH